MTVLGDCVHVFDGDSASFDPNYGQLTDTRYIDIARSTVDLRTGDLDDAGWTIDDTEPPKARNRHTAVIAGGVVLRTAGWYNGIGTSGASENQYASIGSSCDVAGFNGANNAQSIKSKGGGNLFNHAAVSFVDGSGVAHVMILGGDDVGRALAALPFDDDPALVDRFPSTPDEFAGERRLPHSGCADDVDQLRGP
jgi:hypothetical protein